MFCLALIVPVDLVFFWHRFHAFPLFPPLPHSILKRLSLCFLLSCHPQVFGTRRSLLLNGSVLLFDHPTFAVTLVFCPTSGRYKGFLPRLAFGLQQRPHGHCISLRGVYVFIRPHCYRALASPFLSETSPMPHLISRLDITVICVLHKANPNVTSSNKLVVSAHTERRRVF